MVDGGPNSLRMSNLKLYEPGGATGAHCMQDADKRYCRQSWRLLFTVNNKNAGRLQCSITGNYRVRFGIYDFYNRNDGDDVIFRFSLKSPSLCPQVVGDINFNYKKLQGFRDPEFKIHVPVYTSWEIAYFQAKVNSKQLVDARLNSTHISKIYVQHKDRGLTQIYGSGRPMNFGNDVNVRLLRPKGADQASFMVTLDPNFISSSALGVVSQVQVQLVLTYVRRSRRRLGGIADQEHATHDIKGSVLVRAAPETRAITIHTLHRTLLTTIGALSLSIAYLAFRLCLRKKLEH